VEYELYNAERALPGDIDPWGDMVFIKDLDRAVVEAALGKPCRTEQYPMWFIRFEDGVCALFREESEGTVMFSGTEDSDAEARIDELLRIQT